MGRLFAAVMVQRAVASAVWHVDAYNFEIMMAIYMLIHFRERFDGIYSDT
jgi:hypothetical protein